MVFPATDFVFGILFARVVGGDYLCSFEYSIEVFNAESGEQTAVAGELWRHCGDRRWGQGRGIKGPG